MSKEIIIKYQDREYKQILLPVREAIMLRNKWVDRDGDIIEIKMYEEILKNMFDKEYTLEDFTEVSEVDHICQTAMINQYAPSNTNKGK